MLFRTLATLRTDIAHALTTWISCAGTRTPHLLSTGRSQAARLDAARPEEGGQELAVLPVRRSAARR